MNPRWFVLALLLFALAPLRADEPKQPPDKKQDPIKKELVKFQIPYLLTDTQHIMVRAKINGKGPFNFIVDTGAPLLYVSIPVAKKIGITEEKKVVTLDTFDLEGGAKHSKIKALIETPFQLEGMNAMGLPGVELHGIMGYTLLSHYKMEIDFTKPKMEWTRLDFQPPPPIPLGVKDKEVESLNSLGPMMKAMAILMGKKGPPIATPRGFLGIGLAASKDSVLIEEVLAKGPAAGKLQVGDKIVQIQGKDVSELTDAMKLLSRISVGDSVRLTVQRGADAKQEEITITAGEGL